MLLSMHSSVDTTISLPAEHDAPLADSIDAELRRRLPKDQRPKYRLREAASVVYAADEKVSSVGAAGDIDSGKAWKMIRRPSDMVCSIRSESSPLLTPTRRMNTLGRCVSCAHKTSQAKHMARYSYEASLLQTEICVPKLTL